MNLYNDTFKLFSTCIPVEGKDRSALYDLGREGYKLIPNGLYNILVSNELLSLPKLLEDYPNDGKTLTEYFEFLEKEEYIFKCAPEEIAEFPALSLDWDYPAHITNTIIEIDPSSNDWTDKTLKLVDELGCRFLQIRFLDFELVQLHSFLNLIENYRFNGIEMILQYTDTFYENIQNVIDLLNQSTRRTTLIVENSPKQELQRVNDCKDSILWIDMEYRKLKKVERSAFFSVNINLFLESRNFNNYSNRKLFITSKGKIKNTPYSEDSFGKIFDLKDAEDLIKIVNLDNFRKDWAITNDSVLGCKSCEFRYMCVKEGNLIPLENGLYKREYACEIQPTL